MTMHESEQPKEARRLTGEEEHFRAQALAIAASTPKPGKQPRFDKRILTKDEFAELSPRGTTSATILANSVSIDRIESKEE
jgi:hypothetical protein